MKNRRKKTLIIAAITISIILVMAGIAIYIYSKQPRHSSVPQTLISPNILVDNMNQEDQNNIDATPANESSAPQAAKPNPPTFTKSSGNNGSIPVGVDVNFVCTSETNTTCQINLTSQSGKVISLAEQTVLDNGRGNAFTQWYWNSIEGSWDVVAVAKNPQGGISTSEKQVLVVK